MNEESVAEMPLVWAIVETTHPISVFNSKFEEILAEAQYEEVYDIDLRNGSQFHRNLDPAKLLRAKGNDIDAVRSQLLSTLKWRKIFEPLKTKENAHIRKNLAD